MVSFGQTEYRYRADGMRVQKISGSNATRYRYDGQMGIEDVAGSVVTRYGLGARGVDYIEQSNGTGSSVVFPVYDAHGNNVASLSRDGMGYLVSDRRSFDAWGNVRLGAQTGDPTGRYCASIGHKQDDESGLVYMRARYYEPTSGRFVSQDRNMDGANWFIYGNNDPVCCTDPDGNASFRSLGGALGTAVYFFMQFYRGDTSDPGRAFSYFLATLGGMSITVGGSALEPWVVRVAERAAAIIRLDRMQVKGQIGYRWSRNDARIAFYTGYIIFLAFAMAELEDWAEGGHN